MKIAFIVIGIAIIGALFVIQDFGSQTITDPVQSQPTSQPPSQPTPEPEPAPIPEPEPAPIPEPTSQPTQSQQVQSQNQCDSSYPSVCIPPYPPDLDCGEIGYSNFRVVSPDPHGFDGDRDGIGCEVGSQSSEPVQPTQEKNCDSSYPDVCIPEYPPDLDCGEIGFSNFKVIPPDPHRFDGDRDGIGCEKKSSSTSSTSKTECDPSYPDFCIPPPPPDLDCKDIPQKRFTVLQPDPHRFDGDKDGIGCES